MSERLLFISDLHLDAGREDITRTLLDFLNRETGHCTALYILGDLFEVWLGDDARDDIAHRVAAALAAFATAGAAVYLMHGNRDFLLGDDYARACGATLLPDPHVIATPVGEVLLSHGDALCTDDTEYQRFRAQVRDPQWQQTFLARGISERRAFAEQARQQSREATAGKSMDIMDVNAKAVERLLRETGQTRLLHGHTHRPASHDLTFDSPIAGATEGWRLVLGDWHRQGWYGEIGDDGVRLERFPLLRA
ncbi:MAG: UDP-2,3-diacylglucosamine diphosphatase [Pseudohongiellaceae bacterium]